MMGEEVIAAINGFMMIAAGELLYDERKPVICCLRFPASGIARIRAAAVNIV